MKEEIDTILRHLDEYDEEILTLRDSILKLSVSQAESLDYKLQYLHDLRKQVNTKNHDFIGYYDLFLSCICYEKGEYSQVLDYLEGSVLQLWGSSINKSLAHWLLGLAYSQVNEYPKARGELQNALDILSINTRVSTLQIQTQNRRNLVIREKISNVLISLQTSEQNQHKIFSEIISKLQIPQEKHANIWQEWQDSICSMDPDPAHISEQIIRLTNFIKSENLNHSTEIPYINIFLSHCYNLDFFSGNKQSMTLAINHAISAINGFSGDEFNQAIAHWYTALLFYVNESKAEDCRIHLEKANELLEINLTQTKNKKIDLSNHIKNTKNDLEIWINKFKRTPHYVAPAATQSDKEKSSFWSNKRGNKNQDETASIPKLTDGRLITKNKQTIKTSLQSPSENKSNIRHIIVPVDVSALEDQQPNATPLNHELFDKLKIYNHLDTTPPKSTSSSPKTPVEKHIVIPSFSIYGHVSAGPSGEALLSNSEILGLSSEIYEDMRVKIEGREYEVKSINSPIPTFLKSKAYGWFRVIGESMNRASPHPILPNDYVLFCENHNFESCIRKIVIARVADLEGYPPRTMVKRLIKMSGQTAYSEDGYAPELHRYMLHSESSLERDPVSGISFKKDIEIEREYQIAGEVIVIAKPL
jgi:tetratricopeptide (TPR) repeat protein